MRKAALAIFILGLIIVSNVYIFVSSAQEPQPLNVVIIWHFHQPSYFDPTEGKYILPWVRMHSVSNYYKMAYILSNYSDIKVTFTFTGSLLQQLDGYVSKNLTDTREELSLKIARGENLTVDEKFSMLEVPGGFFDINWNRIVSVFPRFKELQTKRNTYFDFYKDLPLDEMKAAIVAHFEDQDFIDLATLFNLLWIDPELANADSELAPLRLRASFPRPNYNGTELAKVLQKHREIMRLVIPKHRELLEKNQTEIVPSPYAHPIMPILTDLGWEEDLDAQIKRGVELYESFFNKTPVGIWSPEMAINEASLRIAAENGILWTAADQNFLELAGVNIGDPKQLYAAYKVNVGKDFYVFFRDTGLSNAIGFQYSGRKTSDAVNDFINRILAIQQQNTDGKMVVTIALDGENPWESYINNGDDFLHALYGNLTQLQDQGKINTITPHEYLETYTVDKVLPTTSQQVLNLKDVDISNIEKYEQLPFETKSQAIPESSWSGKDMRLKIWIGDKQENIAYMWLRAAREKLMQFIQDHPTWNATPEYEEAMDALYRAEASDWCFWYSSDMGSPKTFDPLFKTYLRRIYQQLTPPDVPDYLFAKFYPDGEPISTIEAKPAIITPTINGKIDSLEWKGNATILVKGTWIEKVLVGNNYKDLSLAIIPAEGVDFKSQFGKNFFIGIYTSSPRISYSPFNLEYNVWARYQPKGNQTVGLPIYAEAGIWFNITTQTDQKFTLSVADGKNSFTAVGEFDTIAIDEILEIGIPFANLTVQGGDVIYLSVTVVENENFVETTSRLDTPIALKLPAPPEEGEIVFKYSDPEGDDYGPGTYVYGTSQEFVEGHLDLLNFTVSKIDTNVMFKFRFKTLGGNPWNGPNGFCLQFIHVYIDTDRVSGSGRNDTFGARVNVDINNAWEIALLIGPGWTGSNIIEFANETRLTEAMIIGTEGEDTVVAKVPMSIIGEPNKNWMYVVLVVGWDGYGPENTRVVGVEAEAYIAGGAEPDAVIEGVQPFVFDLLVPEGMNQTDILSAYSIADGKYATVYAVGIEEEEEEVPPPGIPWEIVIAIIGSGAAAAIIGGALALRRRKRKK